MRNWCASIVFCFACLISNSVFALQGPPPGPGDGPLEVTLFGVNNSGFVQTGLNGPDNLVLFTMPTTPSPPPPEVIQFTIVGNLESDLDEDGDGALDSLGTFSGLEWSTGMPGVGNLIGCVLNSGNGSGEFYRIEPSNGDTLLIGQTPMVDGVQRDFADLAFNPNDGLMYGVMNDIMVSDNGNVDFGGNTLWFDSDGDFIPDTSQDIISLETFAQLETLVGGISFGADGTLYLYDNEGEEILPGGVDSSIPGGIAIAFPPVEDTGLTNSELTQGNGLCTVGDLLLLTTDIVGRNTVVSFYDIPPMPPDPPAEITITGIFPTEFFQTGFQASVASGDIVGAETGVVEDPDADVTFADAIIVNRGLPAQNAALEGIILSDDFKYCLTAESPTATESPVDVTIVFTIPNAQNVNMLALNIESLANTPNIQHTFNVANVNTQQFEAISTAGVDMTDAEATVELSFSIDDHLNRDTGQLILRIGSNTVGPSLFFPWQVKYDAITAISN